MNRLISQWYLARLSVNIDQMCASSMKRHLVCKRTKKVLTLFHLNVIHFLLGTSCRTVVFGCLAEWEFCGYWIT